MEILDQEAERRIEESFYEERERMRRTANLPKKQLDHSLLRTKKFFEGSDQKESPKFSLVDELQPVKAPPKPEVAPDSDLIELAPRLRSHKESEEVLPDRRYRSKFSVDLLASSTPKTVEFSPYKRPTSRRLRHSYLGKENIVQLGIQDITHDLAKTNLNMTVDMEKSAMAALELENKQLKAR